MSAPAIAREIRDCDVCGVSYTVVKPWQKRCSKECNSVAGNLRRRPNPLVKRCRTCTEELPFERFDLRQRSCIECVALFVAGMKRCFRCREVKPHAEFAGRRDRPSGLDSRCRSCTSLVCAERNADPQVKQRNRELKYQLKYGISVADYEAIFLDQDGVCAICGGRNASGHQLHVDHDHATGRVRALLCSLCNTMLGQARDNVTILQAAINYLERHGHGSSLGS